MVQELERLDENSPGAKMVRGDTKDGLLIRLLHATTVPTSRFPKQSTRSEGRFHALMHAGAKSHGSSARNSSMNHDEKAHVILGDLDAIAALQFTTLAKKLRSNVLDANGTFKARWNVLIFLALLVLLVLLPLDASFSLVTTHGACLALQFTIDMLLLLDVVVTFRTARIEPTSNAWLVDPTDIARGYALSFEFVVDALSFIPTSLAPEHGSMHLLRLVFLLRLYWLSQTDVIGRIEVRLSLLVHPAAVRLVKLALFYITLHHYIAAAFYLVVAYEYHVQPPVQTWPLPFTLKDPIWDRYVASYHKALLVTGLEPMLATTNVEWVFTFGGYAIGTIVNACVFGIVAGLLQQLNRVSDTRQHHADCVASILREKDVDDDLQKAIQDYYESSSHNDRLSHLDAAALMKPALPSKVELQLRHHLHRDAVSKVAFLKILTAEEVLALLLTMTEAVVLPDELIVQAGEKAHALYIIETGLVRVCDPRGRLLTTMGPGAYFGEVSLMTNEPTTASVVAQTYCKLNVLLKVHFDAFTQVNEKLRDYLQEVRVNRLAASATEVLKTWSCRRGPPSVLAQRVAKKLVQRHRMMPRLPVHRRSFKKNSLQLSHRLLSKKGERRLATAPRSSHKLHVHVKTFSYFQARRLARLQRISSSVLGDEDDHLYS
ncbi:hypothetical protein SDRG_08868 [Saprolegnia diclina VS20]|uniref:Cyclic nucleotide-binding domain-containing protein n=1 Tax=Saprolegnia diclina (strain VS20) TaxID=1156394 RepID=T0QG89_SAPDV|nr:hypothetical protein SDRG_08868 [Saprolegnia diclina VS20]EQC33766.1 hypothetical protein SDRG_08868 [Saprolegnia diclina VS20]|eukprot:XP_008612989.1 hypothetical protein SDRG_08868 [Saprolegnia diclina VS20]